MSKRSRNVRITYPNSTNDILEIDVVEGTEVCLNLPFVELQHYLKDGEVKIQQNVFASPGYLKFLYTKVARIHPESGVWPDDSETTVNCVIEWIPGSDDDP